MAAINTIEEALQDMGHTIQEPRVAQAARAALAAGLSYEIVLTVTKEKSGCVVAMHGRETDGRTSYGRLIRLK